MTDRADRAREKARRRRRKVSLDPDRWARLDALVEHTGRPRHLFLSLLIDTAYERLLRPSREAGG